MNDDTLTIYFRHCLASEYVNTSPDSYEWYNGEPLYRGDPLEGRATEAEQRAIENTYKWAATQEENR